MKPDFLFPTDEDLELKKPKLFQFKAEPEVITPIGASTLSWQTDAEGTLSIELPAGRKEVAQAGSLVVRPKNTNKYKFLAAKGLADGLGTVLGTSCVRRWGGCATVGPDNSLRAVRPHTVTIRQRASLRDQRRTGLPFPTGWTAPPTTPRSRPSRTPRRRGLQTAITPSSPTAMGRLMADHRRHAEVENAWLPHRGDGA